MKTALRLALAGFAAVLSPLAFAHAQLVASSPSKGQVLDAPPIEIRLTFNERVEPRYEQSRRPFGTSQLGHGSYLRGRIGRSSLAPSGARHATGPERSRLRGR